MRWDLAMGLFQPLMLSMVVEMDDQDLTVQDDFEVDIGFVPTSGAASLNRPRDLPLRYRHPGA